MTRRLLSLCALALALPPSALLGQESPASATAPVTLGSCVSGDPMPVVVPPEEGAALPPPATSGTAPVPIPNACGVPAAGSVKVLRGINGVGPDPLYVVDGVIQPRAESGDSPLESIPPHTIESITVVKDRTATTRYGPQAQHGVVIIQTRKAPGAPARP